MYWSSCRLRWGQNAALMLRDRMPEKIPQHYTAAFWAQKYLDYFDETSPLAKDVCMLLKEGLDEGMESQQVSLQPPAVYA